jgi:hypothetical protein
MAFWIAFVASVVPFPYVAALIVAQIVVRWGMPPGMPASLQSILRSWGIISADALLIVEALKSSAGKMIIWKR